MATEPSPGTGTTDGAPAPTPRRSDRHNVPVAPPSQRRRAAKRLLGIIVLIAAFIFLVVIPVINTTARWLAQFDNKTASSVSTPSATPVSTQETGEKKNEEFVINMPRRDRNRLNADGVKKRGNAEAFRDQIAEQAKRDPLTLYLYYMASPLGRKMPLKNEAVIAKDGRIEDGNVYSETGVEAYNKWLIFWETADIEAVQEIRFQGVNTGVKGTKATQSSGVTGKDRSGYNITYRDVNDKKSVEHSALDRCTQPTGGKRIPGVKDGPTDCGPPKDGQGNPENRDLDGDGVGDGRIAQGVDGHKSSDTKTGAARGDLEDIAEEQKDSSGGDQGTEYGSDNNQDPVSGNGADEGEGDSSNRGSVETTGF